MESILSPQNEDSSILAEFDSAALYESASTGQRFVNWLIDSIVFYILCLILGVVLGAVLVTTGAHLEPESTGWKFGLYVVAYSVYLLYYLAFEGLSKGRTVGKWCTRTRVVNEDGTEINARTAFLRSLSRLVPFEAFSGFGGYPWHDRWTKTRVIKVRK
jgi:uncharacterized RDD family membrane protein YckC